ncbi:MAG: gamma-glutamyltransferase [Burkholderiales bacterium]|nr:gamma-glutamyltransferase [Burkholderiales bacterium]
MAAGALAPGGAGTGGTHAVSTGLPERRRLRGGLRVLAAALCVLVSLAAVAAREPGPAAIASAHPLASAAGHEMLERGGNAFDAAVAVAAALAVVEPYSSGLGGGGFWLLHRAHDGFEVMVDARETAPARARGERYLDEHGRPDRLALTRGGTAAAIPGAPAALAHIARGYGRLPLAASLAPAIRYAREGFPVDPRYARIAQLRADRLGADSTAARVFLADGRAPPAGWVLRQPALARTFELLAGDGAAGFYAGGVAQALVDTVNRSGGVWELADLAGYRVVERAPVRFRYRGAAITTAALPSAGGIALAQALGMLARFDATDPRSTGGARLVIEALRRVFHDRARYLGDPDHVAVPVPALVDEGYLARWAESIGPDASRGYTPALEPAGTTGSANTTHLSVIDAEGNRVAATLTINGLFGAAVADPRTGVLLNNEMDDFSVAAGAENAYRLRGGGANAIAPRKRPLSSMTPTFVVDEKGVLVLGAPGGPRIVSQVLLAVLDYVAAPSVDLDAIAAAPRYHHQWWPDLVEIEPGAFGGDWRAALLARGYRLEEARRPWGNMQLVFRSHRTGLAQAASDPRGRDVGWY